MGHHTEHELPVYWAYARAFVLQDRMFEPVASSHDAYVKFIEDDLLGGERIDPRTDGRPDPRAGVAKRASVLGDLREDFDFTQVPRAPLIMPGSIGPPYNPGYTGPP